MHRPRLRPYTGAMHHERSEQRYSAVPEALRERLRAFWWAHPYRRVAVGQTTWRYLDGGQGQRLVLLVPGGHLPAQFWFGLCEELERDYRVVATDAPARLGLLDPRAVADGLTGLLDALGVLGAAIVAHGESGLAAQHLLQSYPHRVQALALVNSPLLDPRTGSDRVTRAAHWLAERLPWRWVGARVSAVHPRPLPHTVWAPYTRALLETPGVAVGRQDWVALVDAVSAACRATHLDRRALTGWQGRSLIITASDDWRSASHAGPLSQRLGAPIEWFTDGGQALAALYPEALARAVRSMLQAAWALDGLPLDAPYLLGADEP